MKHPCPMRLNAPEAYREASEVELIATLMSLEGRQLLELGCGAGWMTRLLAERFRPARILATEVDRIQLEKNLAQPPIPGVEFRYGGAEAIAAPDASFDAVFMFKSLHHVPRDLMAPSLREIHRVLVPGGLAYFCEPVYWGDFNAVLSLVHDEREVREAAFEALVQAVESGLFALETEIFFQVTGTYATWEAFADRFLKVTHTQLDLDADREARIRAAFEAHLTPTGAHFLKPHRIDLLRKAR
ncbi:MAG TPA: class I SAM-dependent methyltransferase [Chromatiaceae bacterium]|nr:class I SAM-dependent methyltransferase [Chromatiaceae bacterium]